MMTNTSKYALAPALVFAAIMVAIMAVTFGPKNNSATDAAASDSSGVPGKETPVRATKGDRLDIRPEMVRPEV